MKILRRKERRRDLELARELQAKQEAVQQRVEFLRQALEIRQRRRGPSGV